MTAEVVGYSGDMNSRSGRGCFGVPSSVDHGQGRLWRATQELVAISDMRSTANEVNLLETKHGVSEEEVRERLRQARTVAARWAIARAYPEVRSVELARVKNPDDWDATDEAEREIAALAASERAELIPRRSPEANIRIWLDPSVVAAKGLVEARRRRRLFALSSPTNTPKVTEVVEVIKEAKFILDLRRLSRVDGGVAAVLRAAAALPHREPSEIHRSFAATPIIESAIDGRGMYEGEPLLTPAVTTYYAERRYVKSDRQGS